MQKLNLPLVGDPCGKVRHHTDASAKHAQRLIVEKDKAEGRATRRVYRYWCGRCKAIHIGHGQG
jgi:hypothetical protein